MLYAMHCGLFTELGDDISESDSLHPVFALHVVDLASIHLPKTLAIYIRL